MANLIFRNTSPGHYVGKGSELTIKEADDNLHNLNQELSLASKLAFSKISVADQNAINADSKSTEIFFSAGPGITISTTPASKTVTISASAAPNVLLVNDNSNATFYPVFASASGAQQLRIDSTTTPLSYNPSTSVVSVGNISTGTLQTNSISSSASLSINPATTFHSTITAQTITAQSLSLNSPFITLGGNTAPSSNDNKNKGIIFRWHDGTSAKTGFLGYNDQTGNLSFIPNATFAQDRATGASGTINASITGSAAKLTTPRQIALSGEIIGTAIFDGSQNITINAALSTAVKQSLPPNPNYAVGITAGTGIQISSVASGNGRSYTITTDGTSGNIASKLVQRDASGNFSAGTISAQLNGNATSATNSINSVNIQTDLDDTNSAQQFISFGSAGPITRNKVSSKLTFVPSTGQLTASGNITAFSDSRLKTDLSVIQDSLDKIKQLTGYTYTRVDTGDRQTGLIAQDVVKVLPEAVIIGTDQNETMSVAYGNMMGLVIEAIKQLSEKIDKLENLDAN